MTNANDKYQQFTSSDEYFKHFGGFLLTEGAHAVAEDYGCYWFMDLIASYHTHEKIRNEEFQVWKLKRIKGDKFKAICEDGNDNVLVTQTIGYSDFKDDELTLWCINKTILLPSEY